jgi:endonuclease/exonuclease/phosphatase family metal-dependent hydrolase
MLGVFLSLTAGCGTRDSAVIGVPDRPLRFMSWNIYKCNNGRDTVKAQFTTLQPDFVFVQELLVKDRHTLPAELGMHSVFAAHKNFPDEGIAILTKHRLDSVKTLFDDEGRAFALVADATVDLRRFTVASVHLTAMTSLRELSKSDRQRRNQLDQLIAHWKSNGSAPIVIGGDFNQIPLGSNYGLMKRTFNDAIATLAKDEYTCDQVVKVRLDYLLCTSEWNAMDGGTGPAGASDHRPIWITAKSASSATREQTAPASQQAR